jgi:thiamine biosynthesis lipoprotein
MKLRTLYILLVTITLSAIFSGCSKSTSFVTVDSFALGTFAQIKCKTELSEQDIQEIIKDIDEESKGSMSIFSTTSMLSRINNNQTDSLDRHIAFNIELAQRFSELSNGAYDITIKPLTDAWGFGRENSKTPTNIDSLLEFVGYELLSVSEGRIHKLDSRVQIDLNSIAKGYTVDLLADRLEALNIADYMVNIGGEIRCRGYNAKGEKINSCLATMRVGADFNYRLCDNVGLFAKLYYCSVVDDDMRDAADHASGNAYGKYKDFAWGGIGIEVFF